MSVPPRRYHDTAFIALCARLGNEDSTLPTTYNEAIRGTNASEWHKAMADELDQIEENHTWELVPPPHDAKPVRAKWVYANKTDAHNQLQRRRARLGAKGFTQKYGIEYNETFAPVAKYSTLRYILCFAAQKDIEMLQLDVKSAFLNGKLDEVIYLEQPAGSVASGKEKWVYRLLKALYGRKQASRAWHRVIQRNITCHWIYKISITLQFVY